MTFKRGNLEKQIPNLPQEGQKEQEVCAGEEGRKAIGAPGAKSLLVE